MYERLTRALAAESVDLEMIFVNDGSPDDTQQVLERLPPPTRASWRSRTAATSARRPPSRAACSLHRRRCVLLDGDLQDPPELIQQFLREVARGIRRRLRRAREARGTRAFLQIAYKAFYRLLRAAAQLHRRCRSTPATSR